MRAGLFATLLAATALMAAALSSQGQIVNQFDIKDPASVFPQSAVMQRLGQAVVREDLTALGNGLQAYPAGANEPGVHDVGLLMVAVANSRRDAVRVLMRAGADPHKPTSRVANLGRPAALALRMRGQPDIFVAMMEEGLDLNGGKEGEGETLLVLAILERDDLRLRQILASRRLNVNMANSAQITPLMKAIYSNQYGKAMMLLDAGADPAMGKVNPLEELTRHKWQSGSNNDLQVRQLAQRLRTSGLTEATEMRPAPVRPAGAAR
jgi:ankyrin repeat protein